MRGSVSKIKLVRDLSRESYYDFCQQFWHTIIAEKPVWNWHMEEMAKALQKVCERVFEMKPKKYDLVINVPPGSSKSTIASILLLPWCWTRMPSLRLIGASFDGALSLEFGNKSRQVIEHELYQACFPDIKIRADQNTKGYFSNYQGGERRATSTGAGITGRHAHIHIVDDPIDPKGIKSTADMVTANDWLKETLSSRCVDQAVTPRILVMQRLGVEDPTAVQLARKGIKSKHICIPAEISEIVKPKRLRKKYIKGLFDPIRFPKKVLRQKKHELMAYGYAGQFEQRPVPLSGGMMKWEKVTIEQPPVPRAFDQLIRFWDKAATKEGKGAYSSGVLMGRLKNEFEVPRFWVLHVLRGRWDTHIREKMIRKMAKMDKARYGEKIVIGMEQEPGSGGKDSVTYSISFLAGYRVYAEKPTGDKFERALPLCDQVNIGNVALAEGEWNQEYLEEMKYFGPNCKYKDQIDASSGAFNRLCKKGIHVGAGGY